MAYLLSLLEAGALVVLRMFGSDGDSECDGGVTFASLHGNA